MASELLTDLELMTLLAVLRRGEDAYGVTITRELEETAGRTVALAVIYATLNRLGDRGLVTHAYGDPTPERGGRAKKYFRVTALGIRRIKATQQAFRSLWMGLPELGPTR